MWVGGLGYLMAYRNRVWTAYGQPRVPVPENLLWDLLQASDGSIWMAALRQEVVRLELGTSQTETYEGLHFQCESPDGSLWFTSQDGGVVRFDGEAWLHYGVDDGLMDSIVRLISTRKGVIWAVGGHSGRAATARYDGRRWSLEIHPRFATSIKGAVCEASDGTLWFGSGSWATPDGTQVDGGVLNYDGRQWNSFPPPRAPADDVFSIDQTPDGTLWFGGQHGLYRLGGQEWTRIDEPKELRRSRSVCAAQAGGLWVGTRGYGLYHFDGEVWTQHDVRDGLAGNLVRDLLQARDGSVWVATDGGTSRYDGQTWTTQALPRELAGGQGGLGQTGDGALWINREEAGPWLTTRFQPELTPPETEITLSLKEVSQPGNTTLAWRGTDSWRSTPDGELHYSHRLDGREWSPFSPEKSTVLEALPGGRHTFEVKARDRDFNEDPTPATVTFTVLPPVWQEPWLIGMMLVLLGSIGFQTVRVFRRDRRLRYSNIALSERAAELQKEISERKWSEAERARLDEQLHQLRYLYRLRSALGSLRSSEDVIPSACEVMMEVLSSTEGGIRVKLNGRVWAYGRTGGDNTVHYQRPISWGEREQGRLHLYCRTQLSEAQERALLDETAGQIAGVLEARELEMELMQSARLVSLGQMAAGVAHEFHQPLSAISAAAEDVYLRLAEGIPLPPGELKTMMRDVMDLVERMSGTVDHMRVFARDGSHDPVAPFSLNDAIRSSLKLIGTQLRSHGIELKLDLEKGLPAGLGHLHQVEQVSLNLLGNARDALCEQPAIPGGDASSAGRCIRIRTRHELETGSWVVAEITDNGPGMVDAVRQRIFEPFFTTKPASHGTGLGLSISYAIVQNHGGRIDCESRIGEGTTFRVALPAHVQPEAPSPDQVG